jgi:predicted nucleotidyltransferase
MGDNNILNEIVEDIKAADPYKIILHGANAKGEVKADSDIELLVLLESEEIRDLEEKVKRSYEIKKKIKEFFLYRVKIMALTIGEYEEYKKRDKLFIRKIEKTGKIIYEKYK